MKGDPEVLGILNEVLTAELTAINQYYVHFKMNENWGYKRVAAKKREEAMEEMHHADEVIERILFLDGVPNMQRLGSVKVGENVAEQHELDLALELDAVARLNGGIALAPREGRQRDARAAREAPHGRGGSRRLARGPARHHRGHRHQEVPRRAARGIARNQTWKFHVSPARTRGQRLPRDLRPRRQRLSSGRDEGVRRAPGACRLRDTGDS